MKLLVCLLVVAFIAVTEQAITLQQKQNIQQITKECKDKTGVAQDSLDKAYRGEDVDDPKLREQGLCFAQKAGIVDESGRISPGLRNSLDNLFHDQTEINKIMNKCAVNKATAMETANHYLHCLHKIKHDFHS